MMVLRVIIVGAGVIGASIAYVFSTIKNVEVIVVEKEPDVCWGVSKANTGIIHPGHEEDPRAHPLRAKLCVEGNKIWREWSSLMNIPFEERGELMIFTTLEERREALKYVEFAKLNNVPGVSLLEGQEVLMLERDVAPGVLGAVYAKTAGIISPFEATITLIENSVANGAKLLVNTEVKRIIIENGEVRGVETNRGIIDGDVVVNAAGLYSDKLAHTAGVELDFKIRPRRGQYIVFERDVEPKPRVILHTTPTPLTKGVYVVTTVHGNLLIGPTAEDLDYDEKENTATTETGLEQLIKEASKIYRIPPRSKVIRFFSGLRPEPPDGNWLIKAYDDPWGLISVAGIRSPGLTAAPAIAYYVKEIVEEVFDLKFEGKEEIKVIKSMERMAEKSYKEIDKLIRQNPDYGEVVCYCNVVSKAEVLEALRRTLEIGAVPTIDGVKFRTTAGFGRCQGSKCRINVAQIISEVTGKPLHAVMWRRSPIGIGDVKVLLRQEI